MNRYETEVEANEAAAKLTEESNELHIVTHEPSYVCNKWAVHRVPQVGDFVSYSFNGDSYPDSEIVSVSKTLKVITTKSGKKYYRYKNHASWRNNGTWWLVKGFHEERNPSF